MDENLEHNSEFEDDEPSREELALWLSEYMSNAVSAETMYRSHLLDLITSRVYEEFGKDGLCKLMFAIDKRGKWISDIMLEDSDFDEVLFANYGIYDEDIVKKARETDAIMEMNKKIWRLRKKYSKLIVDEVMNPTHKRA
jgi:hypothetical protein